MLSIKKILQRISADIKTNHIFLLLLAAYAAAAQLLFQTVCPFAILTGRPCPACGMTRACLLLLGGHFSAAAALNPAVFFWAFILVYFCVFRYILDKNAPFSGFFIIFAGSLTIFFYILRITSKTPVPVPQPGILPWLFSLASARYCS